MITIIQLLFIQFTLSFAQGTIQGTVKDIKTNETIPGANVIIVGTQTGATTDLDGILPFRI
ncbi:MAG: carboxypeptidase-like regulatory domain-containing protein [Bacteroidales bacterium]|nr:carboxypeptidase-like regulatory domain-containing protein [Bacteroidales bacterium]